LLRQYLRLQPLNSFPGRSSALAIDLFDCCHAAPYP
jgi:hypothetical protein